MCAIGPMARRQSIRSVDGQSERKTNAELKPIKRSNEMAGKWLLSLPPSHYIY